MEGTKQQPEDISNAVVQVLLIEAPEEFTSETLREHPSACLFVARYEMKLVKLEGIADRITWAIHHPYGVLIT
jgi:hypothetical protein